MKFFRRVRLVVIPACFCVLSICPSLVAQQQPPAGPTARSSRRRSRNSTPPATPPQGESLRNHSDRAAAHAARGSAGRSGSRPRCPAGPAASAAGSAQGRRPHPSSNPNGQVIESFEFRGAKRVPQDTLKALIISKPGDIYNEETLRRDFMTLWNTGRFDDIRLETEPGRTGLIVRFVVTERRVIRSIKYPGAKSSPSPKFWTASRSARSA